MSTERIVPQSTEECKLIATSWIFVPGHGQVPRPIWEATTDWALRLIHDVLEGLAPRDEAAERARLWLRANGITNLNTLRHILDNVTCRFCSTPLTAARSRVLGYGRDCAREHGLPY